MFKTVLRKRLAQLAALALLLNVLSPLASQKAAQAAEIDLELGANLANPNVQMQVITVDPNDPPVYTGNTNNLGQPNNQGYYLSGVLPNITAQPYFITFTAVQGYTVTVTANGQPVDIGLQDGKWFAAMQALQEGDDMVVLANYQEEPQEPISLRLGANLLDTDMQVVTVDPNDPAVFTGNTSNLGQPNNQGDYITQPLNNITAQPYFLQFENKPNHTVTVTANGQPVDIGLQNGMWFAAMQALNPGDDMLVLANYQAQPLPGDGLVDFEIYTQEQGGAPLGANYRYSYNGEAYEATPDTFSKQIGDFVLAKAIGFEPEAGFTAPGQLTIANQTINMNALPAGVQVFLNNLQTPYPQGYQFTENDKIIVVGTYVPQAAQNATIRVSVSGLPNNTNADVSITNNIANNFPISTGTSHDFAVPAGNGQDYTVTCETLPGYTLSINPNPAQFLDVLVNQVYNVSCQYTPIPVGGNATINVSVSGLPQGSNADVSISNNIANNVPINTGFSQAFQVPAGNGQDYTVTCETLPGYTLNINPNPAQFLDVLVNQVYNVSCQYTPIPVGGNATIQVHVQGPDDDLNADVNLSGAMNQAINLDEGESHNFIVPAGQGQNYTITCEDSPTGYDLVSTNPTPINNIAPNTVVNVTCNYVEEDEEGEATLRVRVNGLKANEEANVFIPGVANVEIEEDETRNFEVEANEDYQVFCELISGYDLTTQRPVYINDINEGQTVTVTCNYEEEGDTEVINVSVQGPSGLDEANVVIPGVGSSDIENGSNRNFVVEHGEDYDVYCEILPNFTLVSPRPIQVDNVTGTRNVVCRYESKTVIEEGFRLEVEPLDQTRAPGQEATVTIRAINDTPASVTGVMLTHDYDQSKLQVLDANGGVNDGNKIQWNLGTMSAGETQTRVVRFRVTGQVNEIAHNNTRVLLNEFGGINSIDNVVRIAGAVVPTPTPTTPITTVKYVYPSELFKSGPGLLSLLFSSLIALGYVALRHRHSLIHRLKAFRQA